VDEMTVFAGRMRDEPQFGGARQLREAGNNRDQYEGKRTKTRKSAANRSAPRTLSVASISLHSRCK
jgi:hypothetical protein